MVRSRLEVPYEDPEEAQSREDKELGIPWYVFGAQRRAMRSALRERKNAKKQPSTVMGESPSQPKNVSASTGRGDTQFKPDEPKLTKKRNTKSSDASKRNDGMAVTYGSLNVPRKTVDYDSGTLNPSEFGPATMGPVSAGRAAPVMGSDKNIDTSRIGIGGFEDETPRMRRGFFGEEIPEDVYLEMERKNKEAGFYGRFKKGGSVKKKPAKKYASGGSVSNASKRADGCCSKGKTKGRMV